MVRWLMVAVLVLALLLIGVFDEALLTFLTVGWQKALAAMGLQRYAESLQEGINGGITKRLLPAVATYAGLYLVLCLLLLRVLLPTPGQWRLVLLVYAGIVCAYVAIVLLAKVIGNAEWAYRLSRQLLDFLVSPLPVVGLYVLLRAGFGHSGPRVEQ